MRVIQTVNDTIRLLFNPKTEVFRLSDFLLVRDADENFLAQVVEVYDDKFDQEANVAKIKLIYRIINGNEITPFDNYTPSRECEVAKIKQSEIEKCINLRKKTIELGVSYFSKEKMQINTNFFTNNCVIFADKFEQTNQIFENLAPRLSSIKPVLILDFSGNCKIDGINSFVAGENFKLPLSSSTIDYIQQKTLMRAKLETQLVLGDIFEEVKSYLESSDDNYIPFQRFIKVIQTQCRQTPSVELLVLISWLKKYSRAGIFAKNKREFETLFKSLTRNKITILDLSNIKTDWQKEHFEYIVNAIKNDIFILIRLNDNNVNSDIINNVYLKKKNITLVPSFAYGYKKTPHIMDFAQNYILMPTLNPKRDFNHANFQIQSLNKEAYVIFGEDTKDFIFTLENETPVKKINKDENVNEKVFISLNLQLEDMTPLELRPNNFEIKQTEPRKRRLHEEIKLSDVLSVEKNDENEIKEEDNSDLNGSDVNENISEAPASGNGEKFIIEQSAPVEIPLEDENNSKEDTSKKEDKGTAPEAVLGEDELDFFEQVEEDEPIVEPEIHFEEEVIEEVKKLAINEDSIEDNSIKETPKKEAEQEIKEESKEEIKKEVKEEIIEPVLIENQKEEKKDLIKDDILDVEEIKEDFVENTPIENANNEAFSELISEEIIRKEDEVSDLNLVQDEVDEEISEFNQIEETISEDEFPKIKEDSPVIEEKFEPRNELEAFAMAQESLDNEEELTDEDDEALDDSQMDVAIEDNEEDEILDVNENNPESHFEEIENAEASENIENEELNSEVEVDSIQIEDNKEEIADVNEFENMVQDISNEDEMLDKAEEIIEDNIQDTIDENIDSEVLDIEKDIESSIENEAKNIQENNVEIEAIEEKSSGDETKTSEDDELDKEFDEILNETKVNLKDKNTIQINENVSINIEKIKNNLDKPEKKLPVFDEDEIDYSNDNQNFKEGDSVSHHKYGIGKILKVIQYGDRCLLQIEFPEVGKRLLDPKIAKLQIADEAI